MYEGKMNAFRLKMKNISMEKAKNMYNVEAAKEPKNSYDIIQMSMTASLR